MSLCPQRAVHSLSNAALISLTKPFTPRLLRNLRQNLISKAVEPSPDLEFAHGNAAVLVPFCNVNNEPSLLFEVRAKTLRSHSGEVSFPGGRMDDSDTSLAYAALRETKEELGIDPSRIELLGEIGPPEVNLRGDMRVWPIIGFVHATTYGHPPADDEPLPSIDMDALRKEASGDEVGATFHLPLSSLVSPARLRPSLFRGGRPYWSIDVTDLVSKYIVTDPVEPGAETVDEVGSGANGRVEVWGLTGWYLSLLMKKLKVYQ